MSTKTLRPVRMAATAAVVLATALSASAASASFLPGHSLTEGFEVASVNGPASDTQVQADFPGINDFVNIVKTSGCSASVVKFLTSQPNDTALVMTNGHCIDKMPGINGEYEYNKTVKDSFSLLNASGGTAGTLKTTKLLYATMTTTDFAFYALDSTYAQLKQKYGIDGLTISDQPVKPGDKVVVNSGYWKTRFQCQVDKMIDILEPGGPQQWWEINAARYPKVSTCKTKGGTSGSPVIDTQSGKIVAINNSSNDADIKTCTGTATCEVDRNGNRIALPNMAYGVPTNVIYTCLTDARVIDVRKPGCVLPGGDSTPKKPIR